LGRILNKIMASRLMVLVKRKNSITIEGPKEEWAPATLTKMELHHQAMLPITEGQEILLSAQTIARFAMRQMQMQHLFHVDITLHVSTVLCDASHAQSAVFPSMIL